VVRLLVALLLVLFAASASGQSVYVAGTIGADVSRVNHTDSVFSPATPNGSETFSGSLRVGSAIGQSWGVELEYVQSARSHDQVASSVLPLATSGAPANVIPIRAPETDIRQSHSDLDAIIWGRQRAGAKVDLVYLGGVAFSRERVEITQSFPIVIALLPPVPNGMLRTTTISYGTRPLACVEARIRFTSHVSLIPGVRLQGIADGWLLRPYVGLGWFF
jgi:hypothetical protein